MWLAGSAWSSQAEPFIEKVRSDGKNDRLALPKGRKVALAMHTAVTCGYVHLMAVAAAMTQSGSFRRSPKSNINGCHKSRNAATARLSAQPRDSTDRTSDPMSPLFLATDELAAPDRLQSRTLPGAMAHPQPLAIRAEPAESAPRRAPTLQRSHGLRRRHRHQPCRPGQPCRVRRTAQLRGPRQALNMGRRRTSNRDLPPSPHMKGERYDHVTSTASASGRRWARTGHVR